MEKIAIYLAGTIQKKHEDPNDLCWMEEHLEEIRSKLNEYEVFFLNPAVRGDNLNDQPAVFGRDMMQVFASHVVFVDARQRRGLGVGAEMMWAKVHKIPVITWAPKGTHYNLTEAYVLNTFVENYVHPFVYSLSDKIVETLKEGADWIDRLFKGEWEEEIKSLENVRDAMEYYELEYFEKDSPMQSIFQFSQKLKERIERPLFIPV